MNHFEMAETLRAKAGVSYEEARQALENSNWDILEAMVALERDGKLGRQPEGRAQAAPRQAAKPDKAASPGWFSRFIAWLTGLVDKGNQSRVLVSKEGHKVLEAPVTVAVLLFLFLNGAFIFGVLISLVAGYRFTYESAQDIKQRGQDIDAARQAAEEINQRHAVNSFGEAQ